MKRSIASKAIVCFLILALVQSLDLYAGPKAAVDAALSCLTRVLEAPYKTLIQPGPEVILTRSAGRMLTVSVERQVGMGYFGTALLVRRVNNPKLREKLRVYRGKPLPADVPIIVKIPNALKGTSSPLGVANNANKRELANFKLLASKSAEIHAQMVEDGFKPSWEPDALPTAPILAAENTDRGLFLFKPLIKGKTLDDLKSELVHGNLPDKYVRGLYEYYAFVQATFKTVKPPLSQNPLRRIFTGGYSIDIRPPNLVWIEDPVTLASLGYTKPAFITYELSQVPFNSPHYIEEKGLNFESYLREFLSYLK